MSSYITDDGTIYNYEALLVKMAKYKSVYDDTQDYFKNLTITPSHQDFYDKYKEYYLAAKGVAFDPDTNVQLSPLPDLNQARYLQEVAQESKRE